MSTTPNQDLFRYAQTENVLETSRSALAELEHTEAVELFQKQLALLKKRLLSDPRSLRTTFVVGRRPCYRLGVSARGTRRELH